MGIFASRAWVKGLAWLCTLIVIGLNGILIYLQMGKWAQAVEAQGWSSLWIHGTIGPVALLLAAFLGWLTVYPLLTRREEVLKAPAAPVLHGVRFHQIGVAVEFAGGDDAVLAQAAALARAHAAGLVVIHVVEGLGADYYGPATDDQESRADRQRMQQLVDHLREQGLRAEGILGYGGPAEELVRIAQTQQLDLLVLSTHGHRFLADLALGQTVAPVLHRLNIPVLVVPSATSPAAGAAKP
jgi:manganese transport protein